MNVKRIAAIVGIVLFAIMFVVFLLSAFLAKENSNGLFLASMFSIIVIPIMIWWFMVLYKWVHRNDAPSSKNTQDDSDESNDADHE